MDCRAAERILEGAISATVACVWRIRSPWRSARSPSSRATGLDQIPEALLPLLVLKGILGLTLVQIAGITFAFFVLEIPLAWLTHRIGLRDRPY